MNQTHVEAACESPSCGERNAHAYSSASRAAAVNTPIQDRGGPSHRILVVDDDRDIRQLCADALINSGYLVDTAEDGVAGWQTLQAKRHNLLITDNNMPKVSGVELVKRLRSARMDLPVVLVSGAIPTEEISRNPSLHLAATLLKPFTIVELLDTVEKVLTADGCRNRPRMSVPMLAADAHRVSVSAQ